DNLYGEWPGVDGITKASASHIRQVDQTGQPYQCLAQVDVNLATPPLPGDCGDAAHGITSHFLNRLFRIDDFIKPTDTTCPAPGMSAPNGVLKGSGLAGGCTRDLVHRYYQERYQLNGGRQNRYMTGSDAVGLTMGHYATRKLPIYKYLHRRGHPAYAIADRFFQGALGGSFLNHQWLVAAASPVFYNAPADGGPTDQHSIVDANQMPTSYPLYKATGPVKDGALTVACPAPAGVPCGDFAVNTIQPFYQPYFPGTPDARRLPPQRGATIGDRLSARHVGWAWYSGGWSNANGDAGAPGWTNGSGPTCSDPDTIAGAAYPNCPDKLFQFHHQPLNYYASFAPGTKMRAQHLRDEAEFQQLAAKSGSRCRLKAVSLIKPIGAENEHPGYASEHAGSDHLVDLIRSVERSRCVRDTMIVVTYDEFGGQWDHVPPPGQGTTTPGPHDVMGPGTRIPALVLAPGLRRPYSVDHTSHDTTAIAATLEHRFGLKALSSRDLKVKDLSSVFTANRAG
ncbi:MAG: alkaline phosphatase family protein, partial [Catenulispora sp.]